MKDRADGNIRDVKFAQQLRRHDPQALVDIAREYAHHLRHLIRRSLGADDQLVDSIVDDALLAVWTSYDSSKASIRTFLFMVARRRVIDELRRLERPSDSGDSSRPVDLVAEIRGDTRDHREALEIVLTNERLGALDTAFQELTARERRAVVARFASPRSDAWAERLELETGKPAKGWRKASDDGKKKIEASFRKQGLYVAESGGVDEFSTTRTSA